MSDSKNTSGWSLRKALARRIAQAQIAYERELNRPADERNDRNIPSKAGGEGGEEPTPSDDGEKPTAAGNETASSPTG